MLVADQLIKAWARQAIPEQASRPLIPKVLDLTLTYNQGIAFGLFQGAGRFLAPIAILIAIGAIVYSMRHKRESPWVHVAMALLASGALGNLYDRLFKEQVTDMFRIIAFDFPIFNLADSCITVAAAILIVRWGAEWFAEVRKVQARAPEEPAAEPTADNA